MENAEEVMQLLEEFTKIKPKDIPRELDDYLGYVAKTGDPVYQWALVKHLFREKLVSVITDFYESTLTVELPPCPNVEPFNYEKMKTSLLEQFDSFSSAPFTVQRICELLTNPRKEYNRADKYMRAIEKNILVVSTREPGSGKRPLDSDNQSEALLNGIQEMKGIQEPGSLIHIPTELPYLGAPPASNDVTVETTELNSAVDDRAAQDLNTQVNSLESNEKSWLCQNSNAVLSEDNQENRPSDNSEIIDSDASLSTCSPRADAMKCTQISNSDVENKITDESTGNKVITGHLESEVSSDMFINSCESDLPDSLDSSDSFQERKEEGNLKIENEEVNSISDENEVSSTPENVQVSPLIQEEIRDPTDSEAEASGSNVVQDLKRAAEVTDSNEVQNLKRARLEMSSQDEINSSGTDTIQASESIPVIISETTDDKCHEIDLECSEITGTVDSPVYPEIIDVQVDAVTPIEQNINLSKSTQQIENPDSSNDLCLQDEAGLILTEDNKPESCAEADSVSESNLALGLHEGGETVVDASKCQTSESETTIASVGSNSEVTSNDEENLVSTECTKTSLENAALDSTSLEGSGSEEQFSNTLTTNAEVITEVPSSSEISQELRDQERREDSVIQLIHNILPDSQHRVEEISVDPSCEAEEEAMDVDDCSNQMMVSEGENEVEPMDQSDQTQS